MKDDRLEVKDQQRRIEPLEERRLLPSLLLWLRSTRRLGAASLAVKEVRWMGRQVDVVVTTGRGQATAFELKLSHITRATEQAVYNRPAFARSYIVTSAVPRPANMAFAQEHGVGILLVRDGGISVLIKSPFQRVDKGLERRVAAAVAATVEQGRRIA